MRILLVGEASFTHNTLKRGLEEMGHEVALMSAGNGWHDSPRDIDLRRDMRWGKLGGLKVLWTLIRNARRLRGNDVVQISHYNFVPLGMRWNTLIARLLKRYNRCLVKGCFGDDPRVMEAQSEGVPRYSDTYWNGQRRNIEENRSREAEERLPSVVRCWRETSRLADALVPCLYEYYLCYSTPEYERKLSYVGLPMVVPTDAESIGKSLDGKIRVLVGIQPKRDYIKGARRVAAMVEEVRRRHPDKIEIKYVEGVPYDEYCSMLEEADVLVDQLYSFTPSMNSLAAMARGTVVIGGGEEDYYDFIGERELRPIINVSPELTDEENTAVIEKAFMTEGNIKRLASESVAFVRKYHDYRKVAADYLALYEKVLRSKKAGDC